MKRFLTIFLTISALLAPSAVSPAQGTDGLLTTLGTTIENPDDGLTRAYLLWQPGDATVTFGKRYAIHVKDGDADATGPFSRLGIQTLQTSPNTIRAMLELGAKIDPNADAVPARISALYRQLVFAGDSPPPPADPSLDAAGKLLFVMQSAATDSETLSRLFFLGRAHAGVMMALGHGFSIPVASGVHTFEVREVDQADHDIQVVGRVTLDTADPVVPAAPSPPFPVPHPVAAGDYHTVSPKDHLNARLRWGIPPDLRGHMPHTFGFDVFRVRKAVAESLGWDASPPSRAEMSDALAATDPTDPAPDISRANTLPVLLDDLLTPAEASDPSDTERIDFADDGIWHLGANGESIRREFRDGEAYYFFVAARGITGIPGEISPGTLVVMCDTLPPKPPVIESVTSRFTPPETAAGWEDQGGDQHLRIKFRQLPESPESEAATGYYIYRWSRSQEYLDNLGNPLHGRIGHVPHVPGETFGIFDDDGAGAPTLASHPDRSIWYTVRAVGVSRCSQGASSLPDFSGDGEIIDLPSLEGRPLEILSGHSAPLPGFLRDLRAPDTASGDFLICRQLPTADYDRRIGGQPEGEQPPRDFSGVSIIAERGSPVIVAADIQVILLTHSHGQDPPILLHAKRHAFQKGNTVQVDLPYLEPDDESRTMILGVRGVTAHGATSDPAVHSAFRKSDESYGAHVFQLDASEECRPISEVSEPMPVHEAYDIDGNSQEINGFVEFDPTQGVREWRVYRRVGTDAPLGLIAKGEGDSLTSPAPWVDDAPPAASGSRVCYFVQVLDQNANPSPLFPVGCVMTVNPDLPTPLLAPTAVAGGNTDRMTVELEWFCDPVGVERFEILVARQGGGIPEPGGLSGLLSGAPLASLSPDFPDLDFYRFQTGRIGATLGDGPAYTAEIDLPADATHFFAVRACGPGEPAGRANGSTSNVANARWVIEPDTSGPIIPWPARSLPDRFDHRLPIGQYTQGEGPIWPIILPNDFGIPTAFLVGVTRHPVGSPDLGRTSFLSSPDPPENHLFRIRESRANASSLEDLMPFMLFRYQLPSGRFPEARPNLVQCTPRLDRMSWRRVENDKQGVVHEVRDPWFRILSDRVAGVPVPLAGGWDDDDPPLVGDPSDFDPLPPYLEDFTGLIVLVDPLPVTLGARYRHLIVRFDDRGEIKRVIPLEPVQH